MVKKILLVKKILSLILLIVALPLLLVGIIQFILFDSGFELILPAIVIQIFGYLLAIPTKEEKKKREEKRRERQEKKRKRKEKRRELIDEQPLSSSIQEPYRTTDKIEEFGKFDTMIYQFLRDNGEKAFTNRAIVNRIMEELTDDSDVQFLKNNISGILNKLVLQRRIDRVQRNKEDYYSII